MEEEQAWIGSDAYLAKKAKKDRGVRIASFLASDVYKMDVKPYLASGQTAAQGRMMQVINSHSEMSFWFGWERRGDAFEAALLETAKDAELDLSEPTEAEDPNIDQ